MSNRYTLIVDGDVALDVERRVFELDDGNARTRKRQHIYHASCAEHVSK